RNDKHLTAWKKFNQNARGNDAVGIYHETFQVQQGQYESVYVNMPFYGLGKTLEHQPIGSAKSSARQRLKAQ
ncbi:DUF4188 domain-containing protein, partial [Halomonas sp. SIMBA_159]